MIFQMQRKNETLQKNHSDFSIEHILNYAGNKFTHQQLSSVDSQTTGDGSTFSWLQCTRFCPPKIPRKFWNLCITLLYYPLFFGEMLLLQKI